MAQISSHDFTRTPQASKLLPLQFSLSQQLAQPSRQTRADGGLLRGRSEPCFARAGMRDDGDRAGSYDVFISYRWKSPDQEWVRTELFPALVAAGLRPLLDVEDFTPGRDVILEMTRAGQSSRRVLCVMSPDYFEGNRSAGFEALTARRADPSGMSSKLIPLVLRKSPLPDWIGGLVSVDWTDPSSREREWRKLLAVLEAPNFDAPAPQLLPDQPDVVDPTARAVYDDRHPIERRAHNERSPLNLLVVADYFATFVQVLGSPKARIRAETSAALTLPSGAIRPPGGTFDARAFTFAIISIWLGYSIFFALAKLPPHSDVYLSGLVTTLCYWLAFIVYTQVLVVVMRGKGSIKQTFSITLELLAVTFVVGWAAALILYPALSKVLPAQSSLPYGDLQIPNIEGFSIYLAVHDPLFGIYLSISLCAAHGFGLIRGTVLALASIAGTFGKLWLWQVLRYIE